MIFPELILAESEKTETWGNKCMQAIKDMAQVSKTKQHYIRDNTNWKYYHNMIDDSEYEYLTKVGDNYLPAKIRHTPLQRHFIDSLTSKESRRPISYSTVLCDKTSLQQKMEKKITDYLGLAFERVNKTYSDNKRKLTMMDRQFSRYKDQVSQNIEMMKSEAEAQGVELIKNPEFQQRMIQIEDMIDELNYQLEQEKYKVNNELLIPEEELKGLEQFYLYTPQDVREDIAQKITNNLKIKLNLHKKKTKNFVTQCVTGKQYYYVDYEDGMNMPIFEPVSNFDVYYPMIEGVDWIQEGPWVALTRRRSYNHVIAEYGGEIEKKYSKEKLKTLMTADFNALTQETATFVSTPTSGALLYDTGNYTGTVNSVDSIVEWKIWWKVPKMVYIKETPNPHKKGTYFKHFITKRMINTDEYFLRGDYYLNKDDNNNRYLASDVEPYSEKKGERTQVKYMTEIYQGVIIGDMKLSFRKKDNAYGSVDNYNEKLLPIIGKSYSSITDQPYSLIYNTKGLMELYDIVNYHKELMLALAGAKGNVIDISQKPPLMTDEEWEYQIKMGKLYIETVDANGRPKNISFNQWQSFDNTLSPAIQYLDNILMGIKELMGEIIGVSRQTLGQVVPSDQVTTFNQSINQSALITEILYYEHDEVFRRAYSLCSNLALRYCFKPKELYDIVYEDNAREIFSMPSDYFKDADIDIILVNGSKDEQNMEEFKSIATQLYAKNGGAVQDLLKIFNTETLKDLEKKIEYFDNKAKQLAAENAQSSLQQQLEIEKQKISFAKEYENQWKQMEFQIGQGKLQLDAARLEFDKQKFALESQILQQKTEQDKNLKLLELLNEDKSETSLLAENTQARQMDQKIRMLEIEMNALSNAMSLEFGEKSDMRKHFQTLKKIESDKEIRQKKMNKEHVSDK